MLSTIREAINVSTFEHEELSMIHNNCGEYIDIMWWQNTQ